METTHLEVELPGGSGAIRGRIETLKARSREKVHEVQCAVRERSDSVRGSLVHVKQSARDGARQQVTRMQDSMRTSPMKWAGVAAGAGFGIGMIGRIVHWRNAHRRVLPDLVIVETSC
jgi:ElaB/YqjD/DUF883 family membrane-anchored ribosome-binding protein